MSSQLDPISMAIGDLRRAVAQAAQDRQEMRAVLEEVSRKLEPLPVLVEKFEAIKPHIERWKRLEQRGAGLLAGVALAAGAIGLGIGTNVKSLLHRLLDGSQWLPP
jgi:hypothetical protein